MIIREQAAHYPLVMGGHTAGARRRGRNEGSIYKDEAKGRCPSASRRPPRAPPGPGAHPALVTPAPTSPVPRGDLPPPLEPDHRSRRHMNTNDKDHDLQLPGQNVHATTPASR
jgi:hypothetical protein